AYTVKIDETLLEAYNAENKTSFTVLPHKVFDLQLIDKNGKIVKEGKELNITLEPNEYGKKIKVLVKSMMEEHKDDKGETVKTPLSYYQNYA
ncbi:BT_3987 domain-containing protein, partial [Bacillus cereus group sp. BC326]|uniref:BT_3987 domain-containing protein n=1 Tax=Bacillus cereus group sp. BC326 TaxID=3445310 RepID=UPI003F222A9C